MNTHLDQLSGDDIQRPVHTQDDTPLIKELSLFTGAGGGLLATHLLGWRPVGYVEIDEFCQKVIRQRIDDGLLFNAPIYADIGSFIDYGYARAYSGMVDVLTAGFPCQPFSFAGEQRGSVDPRNLWPKTIAAIRQIRPGQILLENVPGLLSSTEKHTLVSLEKIRQVDLFGPDHPGQERYVQRRVHKAVGPSYFGTVLRDLAEAGYDARWCVLGADDVGAPHVGKRVWVYAFKRPGNHSYARSSRTRHPDQSTGRCQRDAGSTPQPAPLRQTDRAPVPDRTQPVCGNVPDCDCSRRLPGWELCQRQSNSGRFRQTVPDCESCRCQPNQHHGGNPIQPQNRANLFEVSNWPGCSVSSNTDIQGLANGGQECPSQGTCWNTTSQRCHRAWWAAEPRLDRVAYGVAHRVDRIKAIGNGQVPFSLVAAWKILSGAVR